MSLFARCPFCGTQNKTTYSLQWFGLCSSWFCVCGKAFSFVRRRTSPYFQSAPVGAFRAKWVSRRRRQSLRKFPRVRQSSPVTVQTICALFDGVVVEESFDVAASVAYVRAWQAERESLREVSGRRVSRRERRLSHLVGGRYEFT